MKVGETIPLKIGVLESLRNINISSQCYEKEEMKFSKLLGGFQKDYAWPYKDLSGFDSGLLQNDIFIKKSIKPVMQKQRFVNPTLKSTIQRELGNSLRVGVIFSVHPGWVSNWVLVSKTTNHIRTYINFLTFRQYIMRNPFPPLSMKIFL